MEIQYDGVLNQLMLAADRSFMDRYDFEDQLVVDQRISASESCG